MPASSNVAPRQQIVQRHRMRGLAQPEVGPGPAVGSQVQTDLDVQVLGQKLLERAVGLAIGFFLKLSSSHSALTERPMFGFVM
jgi:hypothetical protein